MNVNKATFYNLPMSMKWTKFSSYESFRRDGHWYVGPSQNSTVQVSYDPLSKAPYILSEFIDIVKAYDQNVFKGVSPDFYITPVNYNQNLIDEIVSFVSKYGLLGLMKRSTQIFRERRGFFSNEEALVEVENFYYPDYKLTSSGYYPDEKYYCERIDDILSVLNEIYQFQKNWQEYRRSLKDKNSKNKADILARINTCIDNFSIDEIGISIELSGNIVRPYFKDIKLYEALKMILMMQLKEGTKSAAINPGCLYCKEPFLYENKRQEYCLDKDCRRKALEERRRVRRLYKSGITNEDAILQKFTGSKYMTLEIIRNEIT